MVDQGGEGPRCQRLAGSSRTGGTPVGGPFGVVGTAG